jgi:hypothetical protein
MRQWKEKLLSSKDATFKKLWTALILKGGTEEAFKLFLKVNPELTTLDVNDQLQLYQLKLEELNLITKGKFVGKRPLTVLP